MKEGVMDHGFAEPDEPLGGIKTHTPAVDAPFEWREDDEGEQDQD